MRSMRSPMDPIFFSHHAFLDKNWALWQDCHNHENVNHTDLNVTHYEAMHRRGLEDDGIDSKMPFLITTEPFSPGQQCGAASSATDACNKCLGTLTSRGRVCSASSPCWCHQRWHSSCA